MIEISLLAVSVPFERGYLSSVVSVSLYVSVIAVCIATFISVPIAIVIGFSEFRGKRIVNAIITTGMGIPSVVVGLVVLLAVSRQGPLGPLNLVFTPEAMILAQVVLAAPIIMGISLAAVVGVDRTVREAAYVMGGTRLDVALVTVKQARYGIATAVLAGFGRAISEVGAVLIVGGNIVGPDGVSYTRTMTTAIQLEARRGQFETALALGAVLLIIVLIVNAIVIRLGSHPVRNR